VAAVQRGYDGGWLSSTFAKAVFLGNGLVAILAGLLAHALVEVASLGPVAPFDAAAGVLAAGGALVALTWTENYGGTSERRSFGAQLVSAAQHIAKGAPAVPGCRSPARPRQMGLSHGMYRSTRPLACCVGGM